MSGVENRVALVTGAGRGIGKAAAELLASRGAKVMCVSRSESELAELGLDYIPPELRENAGEIEAAAAGELPELNCGPTAVESSSMSTVKARY